MVKAETPERAWCVLDRWSLINNDNYACDVDWDAASRRVTYQGTPVEKQWFKDVTCTTLERYVASGARIE
jgi:hypothetical protein